MWLGFMTVPSMSLYIDGTLDNSGAYTGGMIPTTDPLTIGEVWYRGAPIWIQGGGSGAGYMRTLYDGWIAHVAVLTNALSAPQVQQLFNAAQELPVVTLQPQPPAGNVYEGMSVSFTHCCSRRPHPELRVDQERHRVRADRNFAYVGQYDDGQQR